MNGNLAEKLNAVSCALVALQREAARHAAAAQDALAVVPLDVRELLGEFADVREEMIAHVTEHPTDEGRFRTEAASARFASLYEREAQLRDRLEAIGRAYRDAKAAQGPQLPLRASGAR